eukprot:scaffold87504_cov18-Tisochrysis_lutea.AAC.6
MPHGQVWGVQPGRHQLRSGRPGHCQLPHEPEVRGGWRLAVFCYFGFRAMSCRLAKVCSSGLFLCRGPFGWGLPLPHWLGGGEARVYSVTLWGAPGVLLGGMGLFDGGSGASLFQEMLYEVMHVRCGALWCHDICFPPQSGTAACHPFQGDV